MESKKLLAVILILIALTASLEYLPRNILLKVAIPTNAPYPLNEAPSGTSILWGKLEEKGYKTAIIYGASGLPGFENITDLVYLAVGGTLPENASLTEAYALLSAAQSRGIRVHYILLDEYPMPPVVDLTIQASQLICRLNPPIVKGILNSTISTYYGIVDGKEYVMPTGYTGYITWTGDPITYPARPVLPQNYEGYRIIAAAWPYPSQPYSGEWYAVGAECRSSKGSVVIIADSTIAVNLETSVVNESVDYLLALIRDRVESPNTTLIVSDEELYVSPGSQSLQLVLSLHPSVLLMALSRAYTALEKLALDSLQKVNLTPLVIGAIAALLATAAIYSSIYGERRKYKFKRKKERKSFTDLLPFGFWSNAERTCDIAMRYVGVLSPGEGPVGREISRLSREIASSCKRVRSANLLIRYIPLWGGIKRRVENELAIVLSLAGAYDYDEAREIARGERSG
ncbi:MAG: hypothetical protein F7C37_00530 [Desulfurococcales archaeon]|nr:hypothetical protein [Desulfurococcales archaeon]